MQVPQRRVALAPWKKTEAPFKPLVRKSTIGKRKNDENRNANMAPPSLGPFEQQMDCCNSDSGSGCNSPTEAGESLGVEIEYVPTEELPDVEDPEADLKMLMERLDSKDWVTVCQGLNNVRQLAAFHAEASGSMLEPVTARILKALKSPRSALQKTALMAAADLFKAYKDQMLAHMDPLLLQLFLKASQDKQFVCEEADRTLAALTASVSPACAIQRFLPYGQHKNPRVRAKAAVALQSSVARLGHTGIEEYGLEKLLQVAASEVTEKLPEARDAAKRLLADLHETFSCRPVVEEASSLGAELVENVKEAAGDASPKVDSAEPSPKQSMWERFCHQQLSAITAQAVIRATALPAS